MRKFLLDFVPGLVGAVVVGYAGFLLVQLILQQYGMYMPVVPGAFAGLACGFLSISHSNIRGIICSLVALTLGLYTQWRLFLRRVDTDGSFRDFLAHIHTETWVYLLLIAIGTFLGFWWGRESTNPWRHRFASVDDK